MLSEDLQPFHLYQTMSHGQTLFGQTLFIFKEIAFHDDGSNGKDDLVPFYVEGLVVAEAEAEWRQHSFFCKHIIDFNFDKIRPVSVNDLPLYIGWKYKSDIFEKLLLKGKSLETVIKKALWW